MISTDSILVSIYFAISFINKYYFVKHFKLFSWIRFNYITKKEYPAEYSKDEKRCLFRLHSLVFNCVSLCQYGLMWTYVYNLNLKRFQYF